MSVHDVSGPTSFRVGDPDRLSARTLRSMVRTSTTDLGPRMRRAVRNLLRSHPAWVAGLITAAVVFFVLFRTGAYVSSGDVAPLLIEGLQKELGWQWTHQSSGAGGPTYEIARTVEVLFVHLARILGGTETLGQRLLFSTIWGGTAAAGASLAARFTSRTKLCILLGLMTVFNPYVLIAQPNPLPFLAIAIAASMTALCVDASSGTKTSVIKFSALFIPCSYLSLNPPLLALLLAFVVVAPVVVPLLTGTGIRGAGRVLALILRSMPLSLALAAWWAVPAFIAIRNADPTAVGAVTNVDAWAWTHRNSSIVNVLTMFGHWSWPRTEYYGGAVAIEKFPWVVMRWVMPLGALLAPVIVKSARRRGAAVISFLIMIAVFVGKGVHQPFSDVNRWLYAHVPGFWLFREPAAKIGVVLLVVYIIGCAMTADALAQRWEERVRVQGTRVRVVGRGHSVRRSGRVLAVFVMIMPLVGVWPMWTGTIVKTTRFTSDRVRLPGAWHRVATRINESPLDGKTLVLPINDYYQVPTTWGYYGADNLVRRLLKRPVIQSDPQLYVGDSDAFEALMRTAEQTVVNDGGQGTDALLQALGVSHIVVRKDIDFNSTKRKLTMTRPEAIGAGLRHVEGLKKVLSTDVADVFERPDGTGKTVETLGGIVQVGEISADGVALLRSAIPKGMALGSATKTRSLVAGRAIVRRSGDRASVNFGPAKDWVVTRHFGSTPALRVRVGDGRLFVESPVDWQVNGRSALPLSSNDYRMPGLVSVVAGGRYVDRWSDELIVRGGPQSMLIPWVATGGVSNGSNLGPRSEVLDCNNHDATSGPALGFAATHLTNIAGTGIELRARKHSACVKFPITDVAPGRTFHVRVSGTSEANGTPRMCVWMHGRDACAKLTLARQGSKFETVALWTVPQGVPAADLYLYADASETGAETTIRYDNVDVINVREGSSVALGRLRVPEEPLGFQAGQQPMKTVFRVATKARLGTFGPVGDCNRQSERTLAQVGISSRNLPNGLRLAATEHSACRNAPLSGLVPTVPYTISFDHRTLRGEKARYCLLDKTLGSCVASGRFDTSGQAWKTEQFSIDAPATEGKGLSLYLYADGSAAGTVIEYRNVSVAPFVDEYLALVSADIKSRPAPAMTFRRISPARYRVSVANVRAPFILALSDSWSSDWKVRGASKFASIEHLKIDGYRNGWAIDARGDQDLLVEYVPARAGQLAIRLSLFVAILTALGSVAFYLYRGGKVFGRVLLPAH